MFIQFTKLRFNKDGVPHADGNVTIQKTEIAAVTRDEYRGNTNIYLRSGQVIPVMEKVDTVEEKLIS